MARTKISEFDANPNNNTEIDGINVAEGMSPSGVNNAIRELMSQLKAFQAGTSGDSFNGPVNGALNGSIGATTPSTGAFTTLSASSTVSGAGFTSYLASPPAIGSTTAGSGAFTTLAASGAVTLASTLAVTGALSGSTATFSGNVTLSGGTANGVAYLNGSKVLTTGSALTFNGSTFGVNFASASNYKFYVSRGGTAGELAAFTDGTAQTLTIDTAASSILLNSANGGALAFGVTTEQMRLTSTGLGIGTSSPGAKLDVVTGSTNRLRVSENGSNLVFDSLNAAASAWAPKIERATRITWTTAASGTPSNDMHLDSSGNLGLKVTPTTGGYGKGMQFNDDLDGCINSLWSQGINTDDRRMSLTNNAYNSGVGAWKYGKSGTSATMYQSQGGQHQFYTAAPGTAGNAISFTQAATLTANGEYLVGLTSATGVAKLQVSGALRTTGFTVSTLPAGTVGMRTYVTDALAPSFSATVVGGGAVTIPVFYNGSNWIVA